MFEVIIILTRLLFVFYIIYFFILGIYFVKNEKDEQKIINKMIINKQRVCITYMHLTAFLILAYIQHTYRFDKLALVISFGALAFFIIAYYIIGKVYKNTCYLIWNCLFLLFDVGLIMIFRLYPSLGVKQLIWFIVSFCLILFLPLIFKYLLKVQNLNGIILILSVILIISPSFLGEETYGAYNWINIFNYNFQPSEIVKFLFIFYLASMFKENKVSNRNIIVASVVSGFIILVLVFQRDLGGALIFFITYLTLIYIATGSKLLLIGGLVFSIFSGGVGYKIFTHVRVRVSIWLNPWDDPSGNGYQILQSLFAIGTWGLLGSGLTRGYPNNIPIVVSDFIFSAIAEEFGIIFSIVLVFIFILMFFRCTFIALQCTNKFYILIICGFTIILAFQTFLILGGVIKLIPLTGVTLPFISYGGSSLLSSFFMIGIIQCIYQKNIDEFILQEEGVEK